MKKINRFQKYLAIFLAIATISITYGLKPDNYDLLIKNGRIVDGTGNLWYRGDVAIKDGQIIKIGILSNARAKRIIDASGRVVSPGFIDIHTHTDSIIKDPSAHNYIMQGVTTVISGNCGGSLPELKDFFSKLKKKGLGINWGTLFGHGTIRNAVMGNADRDPTKEELEKMKLLAAEAMKEGAIGMSTGLNYKPGFFSKVPEVIEIAKVVAQYGGIYVSHIRNEGDDVVESVKEAIEIGVGANIPVEISHFKVMGAVNWEKSEVILNLVREARKNGLDITVDQYPYLASSTSLGAIFPAWARAGNGWVEKAKDPVMRKRIRDDLAEILVRNYTAEGLNRVQIATYKSDPSLEGKGLKDIMEARDIQVNPVNAAELVMQLEMKRNEVIYHSMSDADIERIMKDPLTMHGSDGHITEMNIEVPHPRNYGTFPRILGVYVREKGILKLEEAIKKMTSMPAGRIGIRDAGIISVGKRADIVIFDPETISDRATYQQPHQYPTGIDYVLVNGEIVVDHGNLTGRKPGKIMYGPGIENTK